MLRTVLLLLVAAVLGLCAWAAMQPSHYRVVRSTVIDAPPATVFENVNDLAKWQAWSPWAKRDPAAKSIFEGPKSGEGAIFRWAGNDDVGEGSMTIVKARPAEALDIKLSFIKPFPGDADVGFALQPEGQGTKVTWSIEGEQSFFERLICTVMMLDMDTMIGADYEQGLAALKAVSEGRAPG